LSGFDGWFKNVSADLIWISPGIDSTSENKAGTVKIRNKKQIINLNRGGFSYQFEPHSITVLEIRGGKI